MLWAFKDNDDAYEAFETLYANLDKGSVEKHTKLSTQAGAFEATVRWHKAQKFWCLLEALENRFWCAYGVQDPGKNKTLDIAVEINPRTQGTDLLVGGAFARDETQAIHLIYNGKIGGGKRGIGKSAFFRQYVGDLHEMVYNDKVVDVVDLGPIKSSRLRPRIARLVHEVARIKRELTSTKDNGTDRSDTNSSEKENGYNPEYAGPKKPFSLKKRIEAQCDHGFVVDALRSTLSQCGYSAENDQRTDLFVKEGTKRTVLFEVKTDSTSTYVQTAVGQLLLNGGSEHHKPRMVMVLPDEPPEAYRPALKTLKVEWLVYKWRQNKPVIERDSLKEVMPNKGQ